MLDLKQVIFEECPTCRAKPGSPPLCNACLHNRHAIERLKAEVIKLRQAKKRVRVTVQLPKNVLASFIVKEAK